MTHRITPGKWGRILANAWIDPVFADKLSGDPASAAKSFLGLDPTTEVPFELPAKPADLTMSQLDDIRSGKTVGAYLPLYSC